MIEQYLETLNIQYETLTHKAVYTIEEAMAENIPDRIEGIECKNLFVKNKGRYYLIFLEGSKRARLKELAKVVGESKLSFANERELKDILDLDIGSVTPLGIINDKECKVTLLIDASLQGHKVLAHPNINTQTISLRFEDLLLFIEATSHKYYLIEE